MVHYIEHLLKNGDESQKPWMKFVLFNQNSKVMKFDYLFQLMFVMPLEIKLKSSNVAHQLTHVAVTKEIVMKAVTVLVT